MIRRDQINLYQAILERASLEADARVELSRLISLLQHNHDLNMWVWEAHLYPLDISFVPYAARGRASSGSSSFSVRSGVNRGMGTIPASYKASRQPYTPSSWLGATFCLYHGR